MFVCVGALQKTRTLFLIGGNALSFFFPVVFRHLEELLWQLVLSWSIAHELRDDKMREDGPMTR